ncbi:relaxase/mobilization nuclease domain-containing protein [Mucilaginibacter gracilis]|nr:relaxase [Mucilaginibacter gracilis]
MGENERISIFDVDGRNDADASHLKDMLYSMQLNSELTRSDKSVYHAYINPNPDDTTDRAMTMEEWQQSIDILTKQLGYEDQRRVVVLHEKPGARVHAHIVFERYNHERGTMATYEHNYKAHDRARAEMEKKLNHRPTPQKNKNRDRHKQTLTEIWKRTNTADEFLREAEANNYKIAKGTDRPFRVIDADGVSFDLVKKLDGINTKEVRVRFGETELIPEKEAIREMQAIKQQRSHLQEQKPVENIPSGSAKTPALETTAQDDARQKFLQNVKDVRERNRSLTREITWSVLIALRVCFSFKGNAADQRAVQKQKFVSCGYEITTSLQQKPPDKTLGFIEAAQFYKPT